MAAKKVGTLIKEARTQADLTQEQLARRISGLSASDISLAERGQKDLTQAQLKQIAKITGVTQASLINAAKETSAKKSTTARKTTTEKKTAAEKKTTAAKKTTTAKKKTTASGSGTSTIKVTATEKKVIELYREADADTRRTVLKMLKMEDDGSDSILEDILATVVDMLDDR